MTSGHGTLHAAYQDGGILFTGSGELDLHASASPSLKVGVFGRAGASVALYGEVWSERWDRTLAEFGSGLTIGVVQPASWDEENGLRLDFADAEFTYPRFDIEEIASSIMDRIM